MDVQCREITCGGGVCVSGGGAGEPFRLKPDGGACIATTERNAGTAILQGMSDDEIRKSQAPERIIPGINSAFRRPFSNGTIFSFPGISRDGRRDVRFANGHILHELRGSAAGQIGIRPVLQP